jgi:EAL and modified HD-GYP domain-containing signal transduction protein
MIGVDGLGRWLNLLLFRYGAAGGERGPLFRVAASRARLLELLMTEGMVDDPARKTDGETAFLVGMLSFVHVLLGVDRASAVENFALPQELHDALIDYRGPLGRMLWLAENLDAAHFVEVSEVVAELSIEPGRLWRCQQDAYAWVYRMA